MVKALVQAQVQELDMVKALSDMVKHLQLKLQVSYLIHFMEDMVLALVQDQQLVQELEPVQAQV